MDYASPVRAKKREFPTEMSSEERKSKGGEISLKASVAGYGYHGGKGHEGKLGRWVGTKICSTL